MRCITILLQKKRNSSDTLNTAKKFNAKTQRCKDAKIRMKSERRVKGCKNLRLNLNAEDAEGAEKKKREGNSSHTLNTAKKLNAERFRITPTKRNFIFEFLHLCV